VNAMSEEGKYFIYFIEQYALAKGMTGDRALTLFEKHDLIPYIWDMYYTYHTERVENAIEDIDQRLSAYLDANESTHE